MKRKKNRHEIEFILKNEWRHESSRNFLVVDYVFRESENVIFLLGNSNDEQVWSRDQKKKKKFLISFLYLLSCFIFSFVEIESANWLLFKKVFQILYTAHRIMKNELNQPFPPACFHVCAHIFSDSVFSTFRLLSFLRFLYTDKFVWHNFVMMSLFTLAKLTRRTSMNMCHNFLVLT